jgi:hypothetical protein
MPLTTASRNLYEPLAIAFGEDLKRFNVLQMEDGILRLTPSFEVEGIGGRVVEDGLLPQDAVSDDFLWIELEQTPDPRWNCCFVGIHCRTRGGQQPLTAKVGAQWPMRHSDLLVEILRRCRRDLLASAGETRKSLRPDDGAGLVDRIRQVR